MRAALLFLALLASTTAITADEAKALTSASPKIGAIDLMEALRQFKMYQMAQEGLRKEYAEGSAKIHENEDTITQKSTALKVLTNTDPRYDDLVEDLNRFEEAAKVFKDSAQSALSRHQEKTMRKVFAKLSQLLSAYAHENGIALVVQKCRPVGGRNMDELLSQIDGNAVLYSDPSLDITVPFLAFANEHYANDLGVPPLSPVNPTPPAPGPTTKPGQNGN